MKAHRFIGLFLAAAVTAGGLATAPVMAAPRPSDRACSVDADGDAYACLQATDRTVPSGDPVTFTGTLSTRALANLRSWTKGDNIVCLDRFKPRPEADGSWPWQTLEGVCTTVRKDGSFTITAEFGRKGRFAYGLEMGPCRSTAAECGNGDPGLVGVGGPRIVTVTTT